MLSFIHLLPLFFFLSSAAAFRPTFNVMSYGACTNRFTDNSNAFRRAWNDACASNTGGTVWILAGNYIVGAVVFQGPCKGKKSYEYPRVFCILFGEREEDSVLVMELDKKVVQYKIASKTVDTISALGPNEDHVICFQFIPSFANV
nr:glycoside hydrolase, family 28 [Tanacetum cinerariifolium]